MNDISAGRLRPRAVFFGAIGVLAETSEIQRQAFNTAFRRAGLDWDWTADIYRELLQRPGGAARIAAFAEARGEEVDAASLHAGKVAALRAAVRPGCLAPRPGIVQLAAAARAMGMSLGLVTTTGPATVDLILQGLGPNAVPGEFDFIGHREMVEAPKPAPDIYHAALAALGLDASEAVAIEDTPESAAAAVSAGITTFGYPGRAAAGRAFPGALAVLEDLSPERLLGSDAAPQAMPV